MFKKILNSFPRPRSRCKALSPGQFAAVKVQASFVAKERVSQELCNVINAANIFQRRLNGAVLI